jgi:hypothetical protein
MKLHRIAQKRQAEAEQLYWENFNPPGTALPMAADGTPHTVARREKELQAQCEAWLEYKGFWRRTKQNIELAPPPMGWFLHLTHPEQTGFVLDFLIWDNSGKLTEVEIKTENGRLVLHQRQLIERHPYCYLARGVDQLKEIVCRVYGLN